MQRRYFSRDIKLDRPYYAISYDEASTDAVTSGRGGKTVYIARTVATEVFPANFAALILAMRELETIFPEYPLDVEFAIDKNNVVTIFQVRPLAACINRERNPISDDDFRELIAETKTTYKDVGNKLYEKIRYYRIWHSGILQKLLEKIRIHWTFLFTGRLLRNLLGIRGFIR